MADDHLKELLSSLESSFDASVARAEEEAASDLALSLLQDASLPDALSRAGRVSAHLHGRTRVDVVVVGPDYVECSGPVGILVPAGNASYSVSPIGESPAVTDRPLLTVLRALVRARASVEIRTRAGSRRGVLARACPDHVVLAQQGRAGAPLGVASGELHVPLSLIEEIRVSEGSG